MCVITATNRDLEKWCERAVSEDLYYRLNVFPVLLPLRERQEDLPVGGVFLKKFARRTGGHLFSAGGARGFSALAGNIRELENVIERG
jgi:transcriptional regulator with GAF, ATPase, and Fis domain